MFKVLPWLGSLIALSPYLANPAIAQSITAAPDGTGTVITIDGNTYHVDGGTQAGENLFHSFQEFGLSSGEIANFLSSPSITNIFGRVTGGDPSVINGLLQVTGANTNLYLMNPAGIVFGSGARLNIGGDFWATTSDRIGFENGWFNATGTNDYATLVGSPNQFAFLSDTPGAILNFGDLTTDNNVNLVGGTVLNQGKITSTTGNVAIAAVPGERLVKISQPGMLLSLEVNEGAIAAGIKPVDLPILLTGSDIPNNRSAGILPARVDPGDIVMNGAASGQQVDLYGAGQIKLTDTDLVTGDIRVIRFSDTGENPDQAVFIDRRADNPEQLLYGGAAGTVTQIVERDENGVAVVAEQLTEISEAVGELESVAIVAEGNAGNFWLGNQWITAENVGDQAAQFENWGAALAENADILLYSCFTALGATGEALMSSMAQLTGADVAASVNATGSANYGGDWVLEASTGTIEADNPFTAATLNAWDGKLAAWVVTDFTDGLGVGTLRNAIAAATSGDMITFATAATLTLGGTEIAWTTDNLTLDGNGGTIDGGGASRLFAITANNATIQNLTLQNGRVTGSGDGAAIEHTGPGTLTVQNSVISGNSADSWGGGITSYGDLVIDNSTISNNTAARGGGIASLGASLTITDSQVQNNLATLRGGGIAGGTTGTLTVSDTSLSGNDAGIAGEDIYHRGATIITAPGDVDLDVSLQGAVTITSAGEVELEGDVQTNGGDFTITAGDEVDLTDLALSTTSGGDITLTAGDDIDTRSLFTYGGGADSGHITLTSGGSIDTVNGTIGSIDTRAGAGNGGNVTLTAARDIDTGPVNTESILGTGGNVVLDSDRFVKVDGTVTSSFVAFDVSISTAGAVAGGQIVIRHTDQGSVPFKIDSPSNNATSDAITNGAQTLFSGSYKNSYTDVPGIQILTNDDPIVVSQPAGGPHVNTPANGGQDISGTEPINQILTTAGLIELIGEQAAAETTVNVEVDGGLSFTWDLPGGTVLEGSLDDNEIFRTLAQIDAALTEDYAAFRDEETTETAKTQNSKTDPQNSSDISSVATIMDTFSRITEQTDTVPALVYALSQPDALELIVVTPSRQLLRTRIPEARREVLQSTIATFRRRIASVSRGYREPAEQLYDWLIRPIESSIENLNVDTLVFAMGDGLRTLPLSALHDGEQFLVEKYSLGQIPSMSLTDSRYQSLHNTNVLAMGASTFEQHSALPAVPTELAAITTVKSGAKYLNEAFTLENLQAQSRDRGFEIVHLATHATFQPGAVDNAYIQLWGNEQLDTQQLRELQWYEDAQVELLVLSACATAFDDPYAELGFAGLAVQSGVKSALATLWQVSDLGTMHLMSEFYEQLSNPNVTIKAEALRQAQLALLHGEVTTKSEVVKGVALPPELARYRHTDFSHPYYWSAFTLVGSPW